MEVVKNGEPGFLQHDFLHLDIEEILDPTPGDLSESRFFAVKDLASGKTLRTIPRDEMVEFVMIVKDGSQWYNGPSLTP